MTSADFDPQYGYPPAGSPQSSHGQAGGLGARFFARLIDGILINIVVFVLSTVPVRSRLLVAGDRACSPAC